VKNFKLTLLFLFSLQLSYAQEIVPSTGGDANGTGGTSSYTVGQVFYLRGLELPILKEEDIIISHFNEGIRKSLHQSTFIKR
jgi:hypothetical protein